MEVQLDTKDSLLSFRKGLESGLQAVSEAMPDKLSIWLKIEPKNEWISQSTGKVLTAKQFATFKKNATRSMNVIQIILSDKE
jgi:hypothetical protein